MSKERIQRKINRLLDLWFDAQNIGDEALCKKINMELVTLRETYEMELLEPASLRGIEYGIKAVCRAMHKHENPLMIEPILN